MKVLEVYLDMNIEPTVETGEEFYFVSIENEQSVEDFWRARDKYYENDVLPNCELGEPVSSEDWEWFFSQEYRDHIMKLYHRELDPLYILWIYRNNTPIGFVIYVIYHSEDGKCFIVDFCIFDSYRNKGFGRKVFDQLAKELHAIGATYIELNVSNHRNERFWLGNHFIKTDKMDEHQNHYYRRML